eukprot:TRINITY_DN4145_c0_g2_i1.p1 TRINITY_DN4145_c0_g2~~TRINITY_DN4145_c0_g2_i1.p1  ORF type:complete len:1050 (-),score=183.94 TRINITY_DN4145_c0_g2_i1:75-3224(-)
MHSVLKHRNITLERCEKFVSDSLFLDANLRGKLYKRSIQIPVFEIYSPQYAPELGIDGRITYQDAQKGIYESASIGKSIGPSWSTHWLRVSVDIPEDWRDEIVHFVFDSGCEAMVWLDGVPVQGLSGGDRHDKRLYYRLAAPARGGERTTLMIEVACNGLFGVGKGGDIFPPDEHKTFSISKIEIAALDQEAWKLFWDYTVIVDIAKNLPAESSRGSQALFTANKIVNACKVDDRSSWPTAQRIADVFFQDTNGSSQHQISAIGHCHIDTAWLWPYAETIRKCARSWTTMLRLMEQFPDYKFGCSQAQQYAWLEEHYPVVLEQIKAATQKDQFIPLGGTWVEMDGNLPSGESFVRQFLYGQQYFQKTFGKLCDVFWLPDTFGYSAQLPQIIRSCGIRYFLTQKLSWNIFNKFPHHSFVWEGIDGTQVLTHFPPVDSYTSSASVRDLLYSVSNYKDKDRSNESLLVYGWGDGGGGPTPEMLEVLTRARNLDGLPKVEHQNPSQFFAKLEERKSDLNTWFGELYFELHRGTYTTQAKTKLGNRKSEVALHDVEAIYTMLHNRALEYPKAKIEELWKLVLLNQFHDVLPGSSIECVYQDAIKYYNIVLEQASQLLSKALETVVPSGGDVSHVAAINTLAFPREEIVSLPDGIGGVQQSHDGKQLGIVSAPAFGYKTRAPQQPSSFQGTVTARETESGFVLENNYLQVLVTYQGHITSLIDKRASGRQVIEPSKSANAFVMYDDIPLFWDAWDVEVYHLEKKYEVLQGSATLVESGPIRVGVKVEGKLTESSHFTQYIYLNAMTAELTFDCEVDWHENHKFLKVEFPFNLHSPQATYEIQYGHLQRPTHFNTSWDAARFEVCAQKWADLSEHGYGISLLNDCKYGYATHRNIMRLSLLRSSKYPDPNADMGVHTFRYSLIPHLGTFQEAGIIQRAQAFNNPLILRQTSSMPDETSLLSVSSDAVVVDAVKLSECGGAVIVRLYEAHGGRGSYSLNTSWNIQRAAVCNMLEDDLFDISPSGGSVAFELTPFQIITIKLIIADRSRKRQKPDSQE